MNSVSVSEHAAVELVDIIDFKWLMTHEGHHVHVERLQKDAAYAETCLSQAAASSNEALHLVALKLRERLGLPTTSKARSSDA